MAITLPEPNRTRLGKSPLELVVCQVRYEPNLRAADTQRALEFHEALGGRDGDFPDLQPVTQGMQLSFAMGAGTAGPTSPQVVESSRSVEGWRFASRDEKWIVSLMPDFVALQTVAYDSWDDSFRPRLEAILTAVARFLEPRTEQRFGLRYVNRMRLPRIIMPSGWRPFIAPELLGLAGHAGLGAAVVAGQQQLVLNLEEGVVCGLRHGFLNDPGGSDALLYSLDYDISRQGGRVFDLQDILATADRFNTLVLQLFQASVTAALMDELK